ncbi:MAG TPA: Mur ligase family protein, partial [Candidatus Saccharimonadales bacterium]|nr:Mur ligase family protein [Candidatus Saccharimonadales bacterium]
MLKMLRFVYGPAFGRTIIYMLQSVEYRPAEYFKWLWRVEDFHKVTYRKELVPTRPAKLLLSAFRIGVLAESAIAITLIVLGVTGPNYLEVVLGVVVLMFAPLVWATLVVLPLVLGNFFIIKPLYGRKIRGSRRTFETHQATKIAIAGSYGKTTMKEILLTVLGEGKKVAATPANKNVSISHALFAADLNGAEEILIIEYGEGAPGDVARFAKNTHPDMAVITGLAPAHLDRYKTLESAGKDIFSVADYLGGKNVFVNGEAASARKFIKKPYKVFTAEGIADWKVDDVTIGLDGVSFSLIKGKSKLKINSRLLGKHQIGPLALAAYLSRLFGLSDAQIKAGIAKIEPFEHRMRPYQLAGGWVIDDTYNGNIEGIKAGLELLVELPAKRKIYVTPGLVDQGEHSAEIHRQLGQYIAAARPD